MRENVVTNGAKVMMGAPLVPTIVENTYRVHTERD